MLEKSRNELVRILRGSWLNEATFHVPDSGYFMMADVSTFIERIPKKFFTN